MNFQVPLPKILDSPKMGLQDQIFLIGSCFTEHMCQRLKQSKLQVLANPHGILFNPLSIVHSLNQYLENGRVKEEELFYMNEIWNHWDFHSVFSGMNAAEVLQNMNESIRHASQFLIEAKWLIITLGSAFQYSLQPQIAFDRERLEVANCHRAPAAYFEKRLLEISEMKTAFQSFFEALKNRNPNINILFTLSPVRHIREGLIENNRSKARLMELIHFFTESPSQNMFYFPAYELIIDVLRDYRFYDLDMVHPNYAATQFVWEQFVAHYFDIDDQQVMTKIKEIDTAFKHRARFPESQQHLKFKESMFKKIQQLLQHRPYLDFAEELQYFNQ